MARRVITMGLGVNQKPHGKGVSFFTAAKIARESVGLCPLSISTTPSWVTTMPQLELNLSRRRRRSRL